MACIRSAESLDLKPRSGYKNAMANDPPLCPACGKPASPALPTHDYDWECRNDACPREGQPVEPDQSASGAPAA